MEGRENSGVEPCWRNRRRYVQGWPSVWEGVGGELGNRDRGKITVGIWGPCQKIGFYSEFWGVFSYRLERWWQSLSNLTHIDYKCSPG